jgi:pimeloyl-ACP methyl ester carboxylesterase
METLTLPDGRTLEYRVTGPVDGVPLLFHHGTPSSGFQIRAFQWAAHDRGLRMVTYSRPGYGSSTRLAGRDVAASVVDCEALLDHLAAPRCVVAGWSGGGPHALATAAGLPGRVAAVATVAGIAPYVLQVQAHSSEFDGEDGGAGLRESESELRPTLEERAAVLGSGKAEALIDLWAPALADIDRTAMAQGFGEDVAASIADALRTGVDGYVDDNLAFRRAWGFALEDVAAPWFVWHGREDRMVPVADGEWFAKHVPDATVHLEDGEGHMSICVNAFDRVVAELVEQL